MYTRLTTVPVLQAQFRLPCEIISFEKSDGDVRPMPMVAAFRQVMSSRDSVVIDCGSREAKETVRQWKLERYFEPRTGCRFRYVGRTFKRATDLSMSQEMAS